MQPPDKDTGFEDLIREYTKQENKPWFSNYLNNKRSYIISLSSFLKNFENEIR